MAPGLLLATTQKIYISSKRDLPCFVALFHCWLATEAPNTLTTVRGSQQSLSFNVALPRTSGTRGQSY